MGEVLEIVAIAIEQKMILLNMLVLLSITLFYNNINNLIHILVWHFTLYSMENGMVFGVVLFSCYFTMTLVKKVIGGSTFCSFVMSLVLSSILRGNSPLVRVSSYP